jgi:hypothetical protein
MGKDNPAERRKYTRIGNDDVMSFARLDASDHLAVSKDISAGGIRFEAVGCEIDLGDVLRVTFNVEDQTVEAVGRVVWAVETDPITLDIGLEFIEIDPVGRELLQSQALTSA